MVAISGFEQMAENTESTTQQCPYSTDVYPMSSELYATDLEDILQCSSSVVLQSHQLSADKETKEETKGETSVGVSERSFLAQKESNTLNISECGASAVAGIESDNVDNFNFSPSPMYVSTNPCIATNNNSGLTVNELASGSSSVFNSSSQMPSSFHQSQSYTSSGGDNATGFNSPFPVGYGSSTLSSYAGSHPDTSMQFGDFRSTSPLLSSSSEQSSVISASPSSLSISSDSCSVAEICELLGESPSVCQQDFSFPGLSGELLNQGHASQRLACN